VWRPRRAWSSFHVYWRGRPSRSKWLESAAQPCSISLVTPVASRIRLASGAVSPPSRLAASRAASLVMKLDVKELIKLCTYCWGHPLLYTCSGSVAVWMLLSGNLQQKQYKPTDASNNVTPGPVDDDVEWSQHDTTVCADQLHLYEVEPYPLKMSHKESPIPY
jgi:hypothetical protein